MKNVKRLSLRALSLLLTLILVLSTVPMTVFATGTDGADEAKTLPQAEVTRLEPFVLTPEEHKYSVWGGGSNLNNGDVDLPLQIVMNFKAIDTLEEALAGGYSEYLCDFSLEIDGLSDKSITADNCYLAGNYGSFGWIVIPTDGLVLESGVEYPVVAAYDATLNYKDIVNSVKNFTAAIYIAPAILEANPDFEVTLKLKLTNPNDASDVLIIGDPAVYDAVDLMGAADIDGVPYTSLQNAVNAAENGDTINVRYDVALTDTLTIPAGKEITLDLNGHTVKQSKECTASYEMISNNGKLTITGNGKISFTDTGVGDSSFGWGSYTIRNNGTLVVENGTIEHLGAQNTPGNVVHMYCAIFQYSGSTTVNGGTISTPTYRSVRLWQGDMTINGGTFEGQVWVQCVNDTAELTINGGSFAPKGGDGSSVFVGNIDQSGKLHDAKFSVTGGNFSTKIGANNADVLAGAITGGTFTESAKANTNTALIAEGYEFVENNGKYVVIASDIKEVVDNTEFGDENADVVANAKAELEELVGEELDDAEITSEIKVGLSNVTTDGEGKVTSITFDVTPQLVAGEHSVKIANFAEAITFRLPVPAPVSEAYAKIYHGVEYIGTYAVEEDENGKYVEVSSKTFSEYSAEFVDEAPVEYVAEVNGTKYETLAEAFANANGYTVKLIDDVVTDTTITIADGAVVTLDLNGYTMTGTDTTTKNFGLFNNVGTFTVKDSVGGGKITLTATNDSGWARYSAVISNNPGGNLTIESGTIEHLGGTSMAYGIDNLTNGKGTSAVVTVNGGTVTSAYIGIRQFLNGIEATNKLTINGGTVTGANSSIYFQSPSAQANTGTLIIGGEAEIGKRIYLGITDGTTEWPVEISIDSAALAEGVEIDSDPIPEGYEIKTENGVIGAVKV